MFDLETLRDALSAELNTSHQNNLRKKCIKALTDLNSQQQKIEEILLVTSQKDNMEKQKRTVELHDLREHKCSGKRTNDSLMLLMRTKRGGGSKGGFRHRGGSGCWISANICIANLRASSIELSRVLDIFGF